MQDVDLKVNASAFGGGTLGETDVQNGTSQPMPKAVNKKPIFR